MMKRLVSALPMAALIGIGALVAIGLWRTSLQADQPAFAWREPVGIMGTDSDLMAVAAPDDARAPDQAVDRAEQRIRYLESLLSTYIADSEISRFNDAAAGAPFQLEPDAREVLSDSREFAEQTGGAFDVTVRPLIVLWKRAGEEGRIPTTDEIDAARQRVGFDRLRFGPDGVTKLAEGISVDFGGIAKGYAIDRAIDEMARLPLSGAMVNIGGDLRCFGTNREGRPWRIGIRHPFVPRGEGRTCGELLVTSAAMATSGDYERYVVIHGKHYSHIIDPRTGWPVEHRPSVTVVSLPTDHGPPSATTADAWATALSVLGPAGLSLINDRPGLEALMIDGPPEHPSVHASDGFEALLAPGTTIDLD